MPPRVRLTPLQLSVLQAVKAGHASSLDAFAAQLNASTREASQCLFNNVRAGLLDVRREGKKVIYSTFRVSKRGEEMLAATLGEAPTRKPRAPKATKQATGGAPSEDELEASTTVTFSPAEIEQLASLADALTAIVATLRSSPVNGKDGAYLMRLLAKVHGG